MKRIDYDHWFIKNNELTISLMRFYIKINILKNEDRVFYRLSVFEDNIEKLVFNFYNFEEAISFTENEISKCNTCNEILEIYKNYFEKKRLIR